MVFEIENIKCTVHILGVYCCSCNMYGALYSYACSFQGTETPGCLLHTAGSFWMQSIQVVPESAVLKANSFDQCCLTCDRSTCPLLS